MSFDKKSPLMGVIFYARSSVSRVLFGADHLSSPDVAIKIERFL